MLQVATAPVSKTEREAPPENAVDFFLPGVLRVRVRNGGPRDLQAVRGQLGIPPSEVSGEPDLEIRFVEKIRTEGSLHYLGEQEAGWCGDDFLILRHGRLRRRIHIPFDRLGRRCELVYEAGFSSLPLLLPVVNLTALNKGTVPVHASGCLFGGKGLVVSGWTGGGKTGLLLAMMAAGGRFISDDTLYLAADGSRMTGLRQAINIRDVYLAELPEFRRRIKRGTLRKMARARRLQGILRRLPRFLCKEKTRDRLNGLLENRRRAHVEPQRLFGEEACAASAYPEKVIVAARHDQREVVVTPTAPEQAAERILATTQQEFAELRKYYRQFLFAFPQRRNGVLEHAEHRRRAILQQVLSEKEAYCVRHPAGASMTELVKALEGLV